MSPTPTVVPKVGESNVLFACSPECGRIRLQPKVEGGKIAPYEGRNAQTWEKAIAQAHHEGLEADGECTNWSYNGAEGHVGWCFLNKGGKEVAPAR